jgi:glutathione S-transferase
MLRLLGRNNSINVQKSLLCLDELGLEYERIDVGGPFKFDNDPDYPNKTPTKLVPTLEDGDFVAWESHTIVRYLCEQYGGEQWYPKDPKPRAIMSQWMDWVNCYLPQPHYAVFFSLTRLPPEEQNPENIEAGRKQWAKQFDIVDAQLAKTDYIAGAQFSMADLILGPYIYRWKMLDIERPDHKNIDAYFERLKTRSVYQEHVMKPLS